MIAAHGLLKSIGNKVVLQATNCTVQPGKITVLIGPSGAGKSTLLRVLSFVDAPDEGEIFVDGTRYHIGTNGNGGALGSRPLPWPTVTVVFQQLFLWPHITLRENIWLPARARGRADCEVLEQDFEQLVESLQLTECIDRYPNETSVGERQRAALARAILLKPRYLLLDEITSSLDVEQIAVVLDLLPRLKTQGTGILLVTHLLEFAKRTADEVLFMDGGQLVESGGVDILDCAGTKRLQRFLSVVEAAR